MPHVWLHHGDSDKESSLRRKAAAYDVLVVAGQAAIDRYAAHRVRIPSRKFKILGRPQVENIETVMTSISTIDKTVVLYAPTCYAADHKYNHSSLTYWRSHRLRLARAQCDGDLQAAPGQPQTAGGRRCDCRH